MTTDATSQLIQRIMSQLSQNNASAQDFNTNLLSRVSSIVGTAANYTQILSTAEGPIAQAAAASLLKDIADRQNANPPTLTPGAAAEASALTTAAAAGVGAVVVLILSFFLAALVAANQSGSAQAQALAQLNTDVLDIKDVELATYWQDKLTSIISFWNSPTGGLGTDLDNIANEGTGGFDVKNDVNKFHDNAMAFVNNLIPSKTPGAEVYWERPFVQSQIFAAQQVLYPAPPDEGNPDAISIGSIMGWYGNFPQPQLGPPLGGSATQMVLDPRSALPFLLLGLHSYLTIEALVNPIDTSQPTFSDFLTQFKGDLQDYASFLYSQYKLAVNGIVKSDIPGDADCLSFLYFMAEIVYGSSFADNTQWWGGSYPRPSVPGSWPYAGYAWNGVYGVVAAYPQYGTYEPSPPVAVPSSSPSHLIDIINTDNLVADFNFEQHFQYDYLQRATLAELMPWIHGKLILGLMARWKAIYLISGYDKVWSILQNLRLLANQPPLPTLMLDQDGTIANGNWSARELCQVLLYSEYGEAYGVPYGRLDTVWSGDVVDGVIAGPYYGGYSLFLLVQCLDAIASGSWANSPGNAPTRPVSFRDRLAAAAV
jgi:hypothetical protein